MEQSRTQVERHGRADCRGCGVRHLALFGDLEAAELDLIHRPVDDLRCASGYRLYDQGATGGHVYTLRSGLVKLEQLSADGSRRIVRLLRRGDALGLEVLVGMPYRHTAVVLEGARVCRIPGEVVERLSRDSPRLCRRLFQRWQQALDQAETWLIRLNAGPARLRVIRLLAELAAGADGHGRFGLVSREDMASILNISKESASRVVADLKRSGLLRSLGGGRYSAAPELWRELEAD